MICATLLLVFSLVNADHAWKGEQSSLQVELDVFSGRPNPVWTLSNDQASAFDAKFKRLTTTTSNRGAYEGLGYRGFKVSGFDRYDEVKVWHDTVEATRGQTRYLWVDVNRDLERFLLETSKSHIDADLYGMIATAVERK